MIEYEDGHPGSDQPDPAQPGAEQRDSGQLGAGQPGAGQPATEQLATEQPSADQLGIAQPSDAPRGTPPGRGTDLGEGQPVATTGRGTDLGEAQPVHPDRAAPDWQPGRTTGRDWRLGVNPWIRLGERSKRRVALVLAVAAGLAVGVISTERQRDAQALRAERDTVLLHATVDPASVLPDPSHRIVVRLLNLGPLPIGLQTVRLDAPGFERSRTHQFSDRSIGAGRTTPVSVDIGHALCTADGEAGVTSTDPVITVGVRTAAGGHKQIRLTLLDAQLISFHQVECTGGYDQESFFEPPGRMEMVTSGGRTALRGEGVVHAGRATVLVVGIESEGVFAVRMRGRPVEVAAGTQALVPFEVTVTRCAGRLLGLSEIPTFQLLTKSKDGPSEVYSQFTDQTFYALSSLYIRTCPGAAP